MFAISQLEATFGVEIANVAERTASMLIIGSKSFFRIAVILDARTHGEIDCIWTLALALLADLEHRIWLVYAGAGQCLPNALGAPRATIGSRRHLAVCDHASRTCKDCRRPIAAGGGPMTRMLCKTDVQRRLF